MSTTLIPTRPTTPAPTRAATPPAPTRTATPAVARTAPAAPVARATGRRAPRCAPAPIWSPWHDAGRPCTAAEERRFVDRLRHLARGADVAFDDVRRADVTAMLNALRCGVAADELLERAPGLRPGALVAAHDELDRRRAAAADAWRAIVADGRPEALDAHAERAALLLPRLVTVLDGVRRTEPGRYADVLDELDRSVAVAADAAGSVEERLAATARLAADSRRLGRLLYEARGHGVSGWPTHLAERVTTLSPARVAALLGERVEGTQLVSVRGDGG